MPLVHDAVTGSKLCQSHDQHLAFDTVHNCPLPNLFVSMLQRVGIEVDKFASSSDTMRMLEMA